jgi:hypothetical protein
MSTFDFRTREESVGTGKLIRPDGQERSVQYHLKLVTRVQHFPDTGENIEDIPELTIRLAQGYGLNGPAVFVLKDRRLVDVDIEHDDVTITGSLK